MKEKILLITSLVMIEITCMQAQTGQLIINGNNNDCNTVATYFIENGSLQCDYLWTLSGGGQIISSNIGQSITVQFDNTLQYCDTSILSVIAIDTCPYSPSSGFKRIFACCEDNITYRFDNYTTQQPMTFGNASTILINGDFKMKHNVTFDNVNVYMSPDSRILLEEENIGLHIINGTVITSNIDCCTNMWDGIYTDRETQTVKISGGSVITNAQHALNIRQGSTFSLEDSYFINNYKNLTVYQGSGGGTPAYPALIRNMKFVGSNSLQYPPHQGEQTCSGIEVFRTYALTIGDPSSIYNQNTFENMFCGIKTAQSYVEIFNNYFKNINSTIQTVGGNPVQIYNATAIFGLGNDTSIQQNNQWHGLKIGGSGLESNIFDSCYNGIYAFNLKLLAEGNSINISNFGVEGRDLFDDSYVRFNKIRDASGIDTTHCQEGIRILNIQPRRCKITVNNNDINAKNRGINMINTNSMPSYNLLVEVHSNIIKLNANYPPINKPKSAIKALNCNGIFIGHNTLSIANYSTASDNKFYGVDISQVNNGLIIDDTISLYGAGINVFGNCNFTKFYCNTIKHCFNGFLFNTQSTITSQGEWDVINTDNVWLGNYWDPIPQAYRKLWADQTLIPIASVRWFVQNSPPTSMQIQNSIGPNPTQSLIAQFINSPNAISSCMSLPTFASIASSEREALYGKIVRDSNAYTDLETQYKTYDKEVLYKNLKENPALMNLGETTDVLYQNFYAEEAAGNIGKIDAIEEFIKNSEDSLAMLKNATLQDEKQIDYFRKVVNEIYLNSFAKGNYDLTPEQTAILLPIATQYTPWEGGDAVYIARLMLNIDEDAIVVDFAKAPKSESINTKTNSAKLYPNPASNQVMIEFDNALIVNAMLEIYGYSGNLLQTSVLQTGYQFISVSTKDLKSGIYYYRIISNNEIIAKDKLLIVK